MKLSWSSIKDWLQRHGLLVLYLFLLAFIPLYPKLPLFDIIPGYQVKVRLEDLLVFSAALIWIVQSVRGKIVWKNSVFVLIAAYLLVGLTSLLFAITFTRTIPLEALHIGKSALHWIRYGEYMFLCLLGMAAIQDVRHVKTVYYTLAATVAGVVGYGVGQIYLHWPLYSTMNREFSKGQQLYLTGDARVQSTFAGHYDLASYLVLVLPIVLCAALWSGKRSTSILMHVVHAAGLWLLIASAATTAVMAYCAAISILLLMYLKKQSSGTKKIALKLVEASGAVALGLVLLLAVGGETPNKLIQVVESSQLGKIAVVQKAISKLERMLPSDDSEALLEATHENVSENTRKYGLSMGIRLDTLWPQALMGFAKEPFWGIGYGTLNKFADHQFTEADSTDNNYLRILGETGVFGLIALGLVLARCVQLVIPSLQSKNRVVANFSLGYLAATGGLLLNAAIIDVFAASKVAFMFWALSGLAVKLVFLDQPKLAVSLEKQWFSWAKKFISHWPLWLAVLSAVVLFHQYPFSQTGVIQNLGRHPSAVTTLTTVRCWLSQGDLRLCTDVFVTQPSQLLYTLYLVPFMRLHAQPGMFYFANLLLGLSALVGYYLLSKKLFKRSTALIFLSMTWYLLQPLTYLRITSPTPDNMQLVILLGALLLVRLKMSARRLIAVLGLFGLTLSFGTPAPSLLLVIAFPLLLYVFMSGASRLRLTRFFPQRYLLPAAYCLVLFWQLPNISKLPVAVQENFWLAPQYLSRTVVRFSDDFFTTAYQSRGEQESSYLITALNPRFVDLFQTQPYELLSLPTQHLASQAPVGTYRTLLEQGKSVYVNDFMATAGEPYQADFEIIKDNYFLELAQIECQFACNFYQLRLDPPAVAHTPQTINDIPVAVAPEQAFSLTLYNHRFSAPPEGPAYVTQTFISRLAQLKQTSSDFIVFMGDITLKTEPAHLALFMKGFAQSLQKPIVYLAGNYDQIPVKHNPTSFQIFQLNSTLFMLIDPGVNHELSPEQQRMVLTQVLNVDKNPTIKNVVILSDRLFWATTNERYSFLTQATHQPQTTAFDEFYQKRMVPLLKNLGDKRVYVISSDLSAPQGPNLFVDSDPETSITYLASLVRNSAGDTYFIISQDDQANVTITPISTTEQILDSLSSYNLEYWQQLLSDNKPK